MIPVLGVDSSVVHATAIFPGTERIISEARVELNASALARNPYFPLTFRLAGSLVEVVPTFPQASQRFQPLHIDSLTFLSLTRTA